MFAKNNVFIDIPLKEDLASTATVKGYMHNVFLRVHKEQLNSATDPPENHNERPVAEVMIPVAADKFSNFYHESTH